MNRLYRFHSKFHFLIFIQLKSYNGLAPRTVLFSWRIRVFFVGKSPLHNLDHFCIFQNNPYFVNFFLYSCTPPSCTCALVVFIPSHSSSFILTLHHAGGGVGNSSSLSYTPSSTHAISSHSSTCRISVTNSFICIKLPAPQNHEHLVCFGLLVTTLSFPFSLHMPLITTFLFPCSLHMPLITTFSCSQWVWGNLEEEIY